MLWVSRCPLGYRRLWTNMEVISDRVPSEYMIACINHDSQPGMHSTRILAIVCKRPQTRETEHYYHVSSVFRPSSHDSPGTRYGRCLATVRVRCQSSGIPRSMHKVLGSVDFMEYRSGGSVVRGLTATSNTED